MGVLVLPLSQGLLAVIDEEDGHFAEHTWSACKRGKLWYAFRNVRPGGPVYLHREIMGEPPNPALPFVDHENGYGLDCRRRNMRWATKRTNQLNHDLSRANSSGFVGVSFSKGRGWRAYVTDYGKGQRHLGYFPTREEAHAARLRAEAETYGVQPRRRHHFEEAGLV